MIHKDCPYTIEELLEKHPVEDYVHLTDREKAFLHEYVKNGGNGVKAALATSPNGMSKGAAGPCAYEILTGQSKSEKHKWIAQAYLANLLEMRKSAIGVDEHLLVGKALSMFDTCVADGDKANGVKYLELIAKVSGLIGGARSNTNGAKSSTEEKNKLKDDAKVKISKEEEDEIVNTFGEVGIDLDSIH